jgi:sugar phosphate isomerase/epimerase
VNTRRDFIAALSAASLSAAPAPRSIAAQLYTVRAALRREPERTLKALAEIGFKDVEGHNRTQLISLAPKLKELGLTPRACTVETPVITANWEQFPDLKQLSVKEAADSLAAIGAEFFVLGYIPPGARGDGEDFFRRTADRMNVAADVCRKAGLKFAWQNHAWEFLGRPGFRPIDLYKERLDPKLVSLELDVFWLSIIGLDPLKLLKDWKGHVPLMRLNDRAKGDIRQFAEITDLDAAPKGTCAEMGTGAIDFAPIVKAGAAAGVRVFSIGQDETDENPLEAMRKNFNYAKNL